MLYAHFGVAAAPKEQFGWLNVRDADVSGSDFQTSAAAAAGSNQIVVKDAGDFKVGQGVTVSRSKISYTKPLVWGGGPLNQNAKSADNSIELRGYDGSAEGWVVYILDIAPASPPAFRWSNDLGRTWRSNTRVTQDWQPLERGMEVRFCKRDWNSGYVVVFSARDQLESRIEKIEGNVLTLKDAANRTADNAVVQHNDTVTLQAAVDRAVKENVNIFLPRGRYRLAHGLVIKDAKSLTIEGQNAEETVLDISNGEGTCLALRGGTEITLRNLRLVGFMGFDERDKAGFIATRGAPSGVWGFAMKPCAAVDIGGTERVLIENCHASRMSGECFVSYGPSRATAKPDRPYTKSTTYLRCSVTDSARNAFNDTVCGCENTSVLNCRIVDVGGCSWEGASRFVKFVGNYVRNAGVVGIGNLGVVNRDKSFDDLGAGQHIVANNVFEGCVPYGGCAIRSSRGSTQVIVSDNLFINFGSSAVEASGINPANEYPSANMTIAGNIFDMTCVEQKKSARTAIRIFHNDVIVGDNQVYVRGKCDQTVTGIALCESALNVNVHDNLIRNCGTGIATERGAGSILKVFDTQTFTRTDWSAALPLERSHPERCRGWSIVWLNAEKPDSVSIIDSFDPKTLQFKLRAPCKMKAGDRFEVYAPSSNWNIHDNMVTSCLKPVVLNSYGSETSIFANNRISRGDAVGVKQAVEVRGMFRLIGNYFSGFDEKDSAAIVLVADPFGKTAKSVYRNNVFERCANVVPKTQTALWDTVSSQGNMTIK